MGNTIYRCKILAMNALCRTFGERRVMNRYLERSVRRYHSAGVVFIHIPKSAGSSVCDTLYGGRVGHFTLAELGQSARYERLEGLPKFAIVRDPADRLVSAWRYAKSGGGSSGSIKPHPAYSSDVFQTFSSFLQDWLINQQLEKLDRIFWPQAQFIDTTVGSMLDHVGRVEALASTESWLSNSLGMEVAIPHHNRGHRCQSGRFSVSDDDLALVREIYSIDYRRFGYV